jgi:hypothetical protein
MRQITWRTRIPEVDNNSNALGNADEREHRGAWIMPSGDRLTNSGDPFAKQVAKKVSECFDRLSMNGTNFQSF